MDQISAPNQIIAIGDVHDVKPSESFVRRLKDFDRDLVVTWNPLRRRFVIEQCIQHLSPTAEHCDVCRKIYVWMVQDEDRCALPLGDHVFEKLREMRHNSEKWGTGEVALKRYRTYIRNLEQDREAKRKADVADDARHNSRDHRVQLNRLHMLMNRHNMVPNK